MYMSRSHNLVLKISNILQLCTFKQLKQIHGFIITSSLNKNIDISSKFLRRSTEFGSMDYSEIYFADQMDQTSIFLWNAMIRGYAYNGPYEKCIYMFDKLTQRGLKSNNYTYPYVLNSFGELGNFRDGKKVHCQIIKLGFEAESSVTNSLLIFYIRIESSSDVYEDGKVKNGNLRNARMVFDGMVVKPVEVWNRMISVYVNLGEIEIGKKLFQEMPERDIVSWNTMISCYAKDGDLANARDLFDRMPEKNVVSWTSMVGAYASSGDHSTARRLFEKMPERNVVSWNSMISSYTQHGKFEEALDLFIEMCSEGVDLDGYTFVSALSACAHLGALELGKWIHISLIKDWFQLGVMVGTSLVEMYAKCGDPDRAFNVFIKMGEKDAFCWNVMIKSLAIHGRAKDAMKIFLMMQKRGLKPNDFTFTSVLFACNHGGLVEEGRQIFHTMKSNFGIEPKPEHYGCLIDLLCRNGQVEEAELLARNMPFKPDIAIWGALLGGCRSKNDIELAEKVMERVDKFNTNDSGAYVLLSNIYSSVGQWTEAENARERMVQKKIWKNVGWSSVLEGDRVLKQNLVTVYSSSVVSSIWSDL